MTAEHKTEFIDSLAKSLEDGTFIKLSLGKYRGADPNLQKISIRQVQVKKGPRLFFLYRYNTRDTVKNYTFEEGVNKVREFLGASFHSGHLFTLNHDLQIEFSKKSKSRLSTGKPTFTSLPAAAHNREKTALIDRHNKFYLTALGVTDDKGEVKDRMGDKWRQINKFVEIISRLFDSSSLSDRSELSILDMGSGKGYLTFATYDYFTNVRKIKTSVVGIETRDELVGLCNDIARASEFDGLRFERGFIRDYAVDAVDILIALHACNTATDEAIYKGIMANASIIICAPCCHQEIRPQLIAPPSLSGVWRHGILLEREAEIVTDGLRALLLEQNGYATKVFEFISTEHTQKNTMIVGVRGDGRKNGDAVGKEIEELKSFYGIREQRLETLLKEHRN